jgi:DivIVA domain-containing protein
MASNRSLTGAEVRGAVFAQPPMGKHGYDSREVDEFMERIAATLDGFGSLTADEVHNVIFKTASGWRERGYDQEEVDAMLDIAASILRRRAEGGGSPPATDVPTVRHEPISGYHVRQTVLKKLPIGQGYDTSSVDAFVERAASGLDGFGPQLTPEEVRRVAFPPATRWHRGYHETEVDALLDRIVAELRRRSAGW